MNRLAVSGCARPKSRVVVGLGLDAVLEAMRHQYQKDGNASRQGSIRTAPYLETCRTKREASLNKGRGTIVRSGMPMPSAGFPVQFNVFGRLRLANYSIVGVFEV